MKRLTGTATIAGTRRYRGRFPAAADGHFRDWNGLGLSSIGLGTYLGNADQQTDDRYVGAITRAVELGVNVLDSAINYRFQRSERAIGAALKALAEKDYQREELIIATKAGFLSFDGNPPPDPKEYFTRTYLDTGLIAAEDIAAGSHCIAPRFLENQLDRSLENLGVAAVDILYIHNPETQVEEVGPDEFRKRLRAAFAFLESAVEKGKIRSYGTATWNAYRHTPQVPGFLSLPDVFECAREVAGAGHHFSVIQLPYNLSMREAYALHNQELNGTATSTLEVARELGLAVMASASILQARLSRDLPAFLAEHLPGLDSDSQRAIQFVRSTPGITTALVGMSRESHVEDNLGMVNVPPASPESIQLLLDAAGAA